MKRILIAILTVVFCLLAGSAMAEQSYLVKKGGTLSQISQDFYGTWRLWKKIAKVNGIDNPKNLKAGQKIIIPDFSVKKKTGTITIHSLKIEEKKVIKPVQKKIPVLQATAKKRVGNADSFPWHPGSNPAQMSLEKGLMGLGFSAETALEMVEKIAHGKIYSWGMVNHDGIVTDRLGNQYQMTRMGFGEGIFRDNPKPAWKDAGHLEAGRIYSYKGQYVLYPLICKNPTLIVRTPKKPGGNLVPGGNPKPGFIPSHIPLVGKKGKKGFVFILPSPKKSLIEHEPTIGGWYGGNQLARWKGGYGEYLAWYRTGTYCRMDNGWSGGLGVFGMYSEGGSFLSDYAWREKGLGPQVGLKYISPDYWQWQAKVRFLWEDVDGWNDESGYSMHQDDFKLGLYTEYVNYDHVKADGYYWGITAEAWWMLKSTASIESTWSGDSPANRSQFGFSVFWQKKLNDDWQTRLSAGIFHQEWDDLTGVNLTAELRLWETIMFGPRLSFYPFGISDLYDDIAIASDLTTLTGFVRVELQNPIANWFCSFEMEKVKEKDASWYQATMRRLRAEQAVSF